MTALQHYLSINCHSRKGSPTALLGSTSSSCLLIYTDSTCELASPLVQRLGALCAISFQDRHCNFFHGPGVQSSPIGLSVYVSERTRQLIYCRCVSIYVQHLSLNASCRTSEADPHRSYRVAAARRIIYLNPFRILPHDPVSPHEPPRRPQHLTARFWTEPPVEELVPVSCQRSSRALRGTKPLAATRATAALLVFLGANIAFS